VGQYDMAAHRRTRMWRFRNVVKRYINPVTRPVATRLPSFGILTHRGRKSGRLYRTPMNVFRRGDDYFFSDLRVRRAVGEERPCRGIVLYRDSGRGR
jgi:hypothetical protein